MTPPNSVQLLDGSIADYLREGFSGARVKAHSVYEAIDHHVDDNVQKTKQFCERVCDKICKFSLFAFDKFEILGKGALWLLGIPLKLVVSVFIDILEGLIRIGEKTSRHALQPTFVLLLQVFTFIWGMIGAIIDARSEAAAKEAEEASELAKQAEKKREQLKAQQEKEKKEADVKDGDDPAKNPVPDTDPKADTDNPNAGAGEGEKPASDLPVSGSNDSNK